MDYYLGQLVDIEHAEDLKLKIQGSDSRGVVQTKWLNVTDEQAAHILNYLSEQNK